MNTEELMEIIATRKSYDHLDMLCEKLLDEIVFYFIIDDGSFLNADNDSASDVYEIINVDKDRPIRIPLISDEKGCNAVIYTTREKAKDSAEMKCRIAQMKGKEAFKMFNKIDNVDGVIIQGNKSWVLVEAPMLELLAREN